MTNDYPEAEMDRQAEQAGESSRLPPHALDAEKAVLGCVLLDSATAMPECVLRLKEGAKTFYSVAHQEIYTAMLELYEAGTPIDMVTLAQWLRLMDKLDAVGGFAYLSGAMDEVPSAANCGFYLAIIIEKFQLRKVIAVGVEMVSKAFDQSEPVLEMVAQAHGTLLDLATQTDDKPVQNMHALMVESIGQIESWHQHGGAVTGISTGLNDFDKLTSGLQNSDMILIAARPSVGKSAIASCIADHVAVVKGLPVGFVSLEMSASSLALRMLSARSGVNMRRAREGILHDDELCHLTSASAILNKAPIWIDDTSGLSILQLRTRARQMHKTHGIKLLIIDYLQLLHSLGGRSGDNRQAEVARISCGVKTIAKELNIPVIVLSQLNRDVEKRGADAKPRLSDLRESGAQEADADIVGLLYNATKEEPKTEDPAFQVNLIVAKHRNGPCGEIPLTFFKHLTKFVDCARIAEADVPEQREARKANYEYRNTSADA